MILHAEDDHLVPFVSAKEVCVYETWFTSSKIIGEYILTLNDNFSGSDLQNCKKVPGLG